MGQPLEEWALAGGAMGPPAPVGLPLGSFPHSSLPIDPTPHVPWGEIANPALTSLSILLPALNEEDGIAAVLKRIPRQTLQEKGIAYSVHLLDGRSTDRTRAVAKRLGAEIFVQSGNGKGSAFREFVPKIRDQYVVLLDSDGTYPPEGIPITEIPIRYDRRIGECKLHLREGFRIALALLKKRLRSGAAPATKEPRFSVGRFFAEHTER